MRSAGPTLPPDSGPNGEQTAHTAPASRPALPSAGARRLCSDQLFAGLVEVEIEHGPFVYRLRRTSLGKLILTK
jgi:hemin uptake protein HemP